MVRQTLNRGVEIGGPLFVPRDKDQLPLHAYGGAVDATLHDMSSQRSTGFAADCVDEALDRTGAPRGDYRLLFERLGPAELAGAAAEVREELAERGVVFGGESPRPFEVDPVPRLIAGEEWAGVERGLKQRVRALNAFLADAYDERRIVADGVIPARVIDGAEWFEPAMASGEDWTMPPVVAHVAGPDLVRGSDGELRVLEDNLRAPSGLTFALAARDAMARVVGASGLEPRSLSPALGALERTLASAAPDGVEDPRVVLLTDGPESVTYYEHEELSRVLGLPLATPGEMRRDGDRLLLESDGDAPIDVIYRRLDDERLTLDDGTVTPLGELLLEPIAAGTLGCANSPGSGIGDDKAVHTYVEGMIGYYLGEEVLLPSVHGWDLGDPEQLAAVLPQLGRLVIKPRGEFGGRGVTIGPLASAGELERATAAVRAEPERFVAQEPIPLSVHPTVIGNRLENRHVDLRPFVLSSGEETFVMPGGLTRFAREEGEMVVNSGQGGGAKDTWIL